MTMGFPIFFGMGAAGTVFFGAPATAPLFGARPQQQPPHRQKSQPQHVMWVAFAVLGLTQHPSVQHWQQLAYIAKMATMMLQMPGPKRLTALSKKDVMHTHMLPMASTCVILDAIPAAVKAAVAFRSAGKVSQVPVIGAKIDWAKGSCTTGPRAAAITPTIKLRMIQTYVIKRKSFEQDEQLFVSFAFNAHMLWRNMKRADNAAGMATKMLSRLRTGRIGSTRLKIEEKLEESLSSRNLSMMHTMLACKLVIAVYSKKPPPSMKMAAQSVVRAQPLDAYTEQQPVEQQPPREGNVPAFIG